MSGHPVTSYSSSGKKKTSKEKETAAIFDSRSLPRLASAPSSSTRYLQSSGGDGNSDLAVHQQQQHLRDATGSLSHTILLQARTSQTNQSGRKKAAHRSDAERRKVHQKQQNTMIATHQAEEEQKNSSVSTTENAQRIDQSHGTTPDLSMTSTGTTATSTTHTNNGSSYHQTWVQEDTSVQEGQDFNEVIGGLLTQLRLAYTMAAEQEVSVSNVDSSVVSSSVGQASRQAVIEDLIFHAETHFREKIREFCALQYSQCLDENDQLRETLRREQQKAEARNTAQLELLRSIREELAASQQRENMMRYEKDVEHEQRREMLNFEKTENLVLRAEVCRCKDKIYHLQCIVDQISHAPPSLEEVCACCSMNTPSDGKGTRKEDDVAVVCSDASIQTAVDASCRKDEECMTDFNIESLLEAEKLKNLEIEEKSREVPSHATEQTAGKSQQCAVAAATATQEEQQGSLDHIMAHEEMVMRILASVDAASVRRSILGTVQY